MYFALHYEYVDDILARRAAHREAHLGLLRDYVERGELILGGAYAEPVDGALLVFRVDSEADVEAFVRDDPYANNGLVTNWRIRPWTVVIGTAASAPGV